MLIDYEHFFLSSRRRHTRWPRDWSSDVCSSDLPCGLTRGPWLGQLGRHQPRSPVVTGGLPTAWSTVELCLDRFAKIVVGGELHQLVVDEEARGGTDAERDGTIEGRLHALGRGRVGHGGGVPGQVETKRLGELTDQRRVGLAIGRVYV